jgi:hypothetical protein
MTMATVEASSAQIRPGRMARLKDAAERALPSPSMVVFGSAGWGAILMISALSGIWLRNGLIVVNPFAIASVFFYGGALAFAPAFWLSMLILRRRGAITRFMGGTLIFAFGTHLAASAIFALQYKVFYAHWHASFPSIVWFFQLAFTSAGAVFTFTVGSLHYYYWPVSCLAFLGVGLWFALRSRSEAH